MSQCTKNLQNSQLWLLFCLKRKSQIQKTNSILLSKLRKLEKNSCCTENSPGNCQTFRNKTAFSIQKHQQTKYSKPFHCVGHKALFKLLLLYVRTCHRFNFKASKSSKALKGALAFFFITFRKKEVQYFEQFSVKKFCKSSDLRT